MKKILLLILLLIPSVASAQLSTFQGGTGTTSPSGILYGDQTIRLKTVNVGTGLNFSGGILSATGGSSSFSTSSIAYYLSQFQPFYYTGGLAPYLAPTTTVGLQIGGSTYLATSTGTKVGIATTSPWALLSIDANGLAGPEFAVGSSTKTDLVVTNGGNVGISTTSPYMKLSVDTGSVSVSGASNFVDLIYLGTAAGVNPVIKYSSNTVESLPTGLAKNNGSPFFNIAAASGATIVGGGITGESFRRIRITADGLFLLGGGSVAADTGMARNAAGVIEVNNGTANTLRDITVRSASTTGQTVLATTGGNVGIASSSPWALLSVDANGISGPAFAIGSSTITNFQVNNGGGVQIVGPKTISAGTASTHPLSIIPQTRSDGQSVVYFGIDQTTGLAGTIGVTGSGLNLGDRDQTVLFQEERAGITINGSASGGTTGGSTNVRTVTMNPSSYNAYGSELEALHITSQTITEALPFTTQRFNQITQPTLTATTTANTFIGTTSTFYIGGAPRVTASGAASTSIGLLIDPGTAMAATTNASTTIGLEAFAPSGGASNFAAVFLGGNVGINTANPTSPLTVAGGILSTSNSAAAITSTGGFSSLTGQYLSGGSVSLSLNAGNTITNDIFIRASNKYVGLSTTTPSSKLDIAGITPVLTLTDTTAGVDGQHFFMTNNNGTFSIGTTTDTFTSTSTYLTINNLGKVGIGSTSPAQALSVQGNGLFSGNITAANITATGTITFANLLVTSSSTLQNFTFANATGSSATTTNFFATTASSTNLFSQNLVANIKAYPSVTYATSSPWTGTTTIPLGTAYVGEIWNGVQCFTDTGTLNLDFYHTSTHLTLLNGSTTVGTFTWTSNNSLAAAEKRFVDIGTPASSPTKISCTVSKTYPTN